jgi:hypothetical protein
MSMSGEAWRAVSPLATVEITPFLATGNSHVGEGKRG